MRPHASQAFAPHPSLHFSLFSVTGALWLALIFARPLHAQRTTDDDATKVLDELVVSSEADARFDPTGMGATEAEMNEPPFSNDLLGGTVREEDFNNELTHELQLATGASPADLATAVNRVNLRGFPTPRLRNGFSQTGIPEVLAVERVELIQGPLTPVAGRAAPGGIQNFVTARPRGKAHTRIETFASTHRERQVRSENSAILIPKKLWHRLAAGWQLREGPEAFSRSETKYVSGALTLRHSRSASTLVMLDYSELRANPSAGVPEFRPSASQKIVGPYRPLASFHAYGPHAGIEKTLANASAQFEAQIGSHISVRASLQGWLRELAEDRFTTSQYLLDAGRFGGTREPQHTEQPLRAVTGGVETTARFFAFKSDHKLTLLVESNHVRYTREQRALPTAARNALPADVRTFDPDEPNYFRPDFDPSVYSRILTDRMETTGYNALSLGERAAFNQGRLVTTTGVRADFVALDVHDERPGTTRPRAHDRVRELTYHAGANYQVKPSRLLVFANTSTAFEPSTRIDARTGRIQGNETTLGFEAGAKGLFLDRRLSATALLFRFFNRNISRRNPLYDDPIADATQTQPQLVAAGEERFSGGTLDVKASVTPRWTLSGRATVTQAITTRSPDLPEEIGRPLSRLPRSTLGLSSRHTFTGRFNGLSLGSTLTYVSGFVSTYENSSRLALAYPSNTLIGLSAGYTWKTGAKARPFTHNAGLNVRNLLDRDQLAALARTGQERDFGASYSLTF